MDEIRGNKPIQAAKKKRAGNTANGVEMIIATIPAESGWTPPRSPGKAAQVGRIVQRLRRCNSSVFHFERVITIMTSEGCCGKLPQDHVIYLFPCVRPITLVLRFCHKTTWEIGGDCWDKIARRISPFPRIIYGGARNLPVPQGVLKRRNAPKRHLAPVITSGGRREVKSLFTTAFDTAAIDRTWLVTFTAVRLIDIVSQDLGERDVRNLGGSRKYPICTFHILRTPSMVACHACKGRNRRQRHL